jgi:elongation factor P
MLTINDLRIGTKIIFNNAPHVVIYTEHSKLGRGGGILRTKIKNLITGAQIEKTFAGAEKLEEASLETKKAQFLYQADNLFYFMDLQTFEQFTLNATQLGNFAKFLCDGENVDILYFRDEPINVQLPIKIQLKVSYAEPGFKGNTASTVQKPATLENGTKINVPLFIKENDIIVVDTRTGQYVERA